MIKLTIQPEAEAWLKEEMNLQSGDGVRFFGKYGGSTNQHVGFSTGIEKTIAEEPLVSVKLHGIDYFIETQDEWFFNNFHLHVGYDEKKEEPYFDYQKAE